MPAQTTKAFQPAPTHLSMLALSLSALGVVFGDIGTSTRNHSWVIRRFLKFRWKTFFLVHANGVAVSL